MPHEVSHEVEDPLFASDPWKHPIQAVVEGRAVDERVRAAAVAIPQEVVVQVPVPQIQTVEKIVEVPQVQTVEKICLFPSFRCRRSLCRFPES